MDPVINAKMQSYWTQIATAFAGYDHRLLFAGTNEPDAETAAQWATLMVYHQTFVDAVRATGGVATATSYLIGPAPVSPDRHATVVQLLIESDGDAKPVVKAVQEASGGAFTAAITGDHSVSNDFNTLSQRDLEHGELAIGLPALQADALAPPALTMLVLLALAAFEAVAPPHHWWDWSPAAPAAPPSGSPPGWAFLILPRPACRRRETLRGGARCLFET